MTTTVAWIFFAICAVTAGAFFVFYRTREAELLRRAEQAERKLALLAQIAPSLTHAAMQSLPSTCERIVERFGALVQAQTILCLVARDGRLVVGAKSDDGYAGFLRAGDPCEGDSIVDWVVRFGSPAIVGPRPANLGTEAGVTDLSGVMHSAPGAPLVGSRDRVWALCIPMLEERGPGLRPSFLGAIYAERRHDEPFAAEDASTASMIARLAADALKRASFADEVKREAEVDQLTGLLSAGTFRKRLREEVESRRFARGDVALFFIDTDKFKLWNDTFGHVVGDTLLKRLAGIFADVASTGGFAGRNGGDEFCVALLDRTKDDAVEVAERLRERVERTDLGASDEGVPTPRIPITVSIGVAHFPVDVPATAEAPSGRLLEAADARMYEAKRAGRNQVAYSRARALPTKLRFPGEGPIPRR